MFDYSTLIVAGIGAFSLALAFLEYTFSKKKERKSIITKQDSAQRIRKSRFLEVMLFSA
jgi:mannose/fructose/N-acetylgalactosamine-specific phosphotransferase system component IIC